MSLVYGADEAGRGPILGPMTIAVVGVDDAAARELVELGVADSKRFGSNEEGRRQRRELAERIRERVPACRLRMVEVEEIDHYTFRGQLNALERRVVLELLAALEQDPVVIIPVGSVEQHGPHCPQDVDISGPYHIAIATADAIDDFPVIVAPPVMYGFTHYNMGEVGTLTLKLELFIELLCDISRSLWANGFKRIILLNGHGGNLAPTWNASVKLAEEDVWALALTYWNMVPDELLAWSEADEGSIGHGGEWETSLQLHLRPHLSARRCRPLAAFGHQAAQDAVGRRRGSGGVFTA